MSRAVYAVFVVLSVGLLGLQSLPAVPYASCITNTAGTLSWILNDNADNVKVLFNNATITNDLGARSKGVSSFSIGAATNYQIRVTRNAARAWTKISVDTNPLLEFNSPRGIAVNMSARESRVFGRIYIANSLAGTASNYLTHITRAAGDGIYVLNADQSDALGQGNTALTAGIAFTASQSDPWKLAFGRDDNLLYVNNFANADCDTWAVDADFTTAIPVLAVLGLNPVHYDPANTPIVTGSIAGGNLTLWNIDGSRPGAFNTIARWDIGAGPLPYGNPPATLGFADHAPNDLTTASLTTDLEVGPDHKVYTSIYRALNDTASIRVFAPDGLTPLWDSLSAGGSPDKFLLTRAITLSADGKTLIALRDDSSVLLVTLVNGLPSLATLTIVSNLPASNGGSLSTSRDVACDAAGNIYTASGTNHTGVHILSPGGLTVAITGNDLSGTNGTFSITNVNPVTISGPQNQVVCLGNAISFTVSAVGTPPNSYQWLTNGLPVLTGTNSVFTISSAASADALNNYAVIVSDLFTSVTSAPVTLRVSTTPPNITGAPTNQSSAVGSNVTFNLSVASSLPRTIQWRTNGIPIPWGTNFNLSLTNIAVADSLRSYDVVISNACGVVTSSPPAQLLIPHGFYVCDGLAGFFGGMNLIHTNQSGMAIYAWSSADPIAPIPSWTSEGQLGEQPLGGNKSRYTINVIPASDLVYYLVGQANVSPFISPAPVEEVISDPSGAYIFSTTNVSVNSAGVLGLPAPPLIAQPPVSRTLLTGENATLSPVVTGSSPLNYQWLFNTNLALPGATNRTLTLTNVTPSDAGLYSILVTNAYGSATSSPATLAVQSPPVISSTKLTNGLQLSAFAIPGDTFWVESATNLTPPVTWQIIAADLVSSNGLVQYLDPWPAAAPVRFYRLAFPSFDATAPFIFQQPVGLTVLAGRGAAFSIGATGNAPLGYRWFFNTNAPIANALASTLVLSNLNTNNSGSYTVVVTNAYGAVTSSFAMLQVLPTPHLNAEIASDELQLSATIVPGDSCRLQAAVSLVAPVNWTTISTGAAAADGSVHFSDKSYGTNQNRFYRLVTP